MNENTSTWFKKNEKKSLFKWNEIVFGMLKMGEWLKMKMQVKAESMILNGDPREMICEAAEQMQVNLLVLGSRGLGALKR